MATYPIDPDVRRIARRFGIDPKLIHAVVKAEGNIIKAVQCSLPSITTEEQALDVTCRSAVHAMSDFIKAKHAEEFVQFWGSRWAPRGVANDPTDLNRHWPLNVLRIWLGYHA